jgi:hypothetical protein
LSCRNEAVSLTRPCRRLATFAASRQTPRAPEVHIVRLLEVRATKDGERIGDRTGKAFVVRSPPYTFLPRFPLHHLLIAHPECPTPLRFQSSLGNRHFAGTAAANELPRIAPRSTGWLPRRPFHPASLRHGSVISSGARGPTRARLLRWAT